MSHITFFTTILCVPHPSKKSFAPALLARKKQKIKQKKDVCASENSGEKALQFGSLHCQRSTTCQILVCDIQRSMPSVLQVLWFKTTFNMFDCFSWWSFHTQFDIIIHFAVHPKVAVQCMIMYFKQNQWVHPLVSLVPSQCSPAGTTCRMISHHSRSNRFERHEQGNEKQKKFPQCAGWVPSRLKISLCPIRRVLFADAASSFVENV